MPEDQDYPESRDFPYFSVLEKYLSEEMERFLERCRKISTSMHLPLQYCDITAWAAEDAIIIHREDRVDLEHFGKFQYVDKDYVKKIGDYIIYTVDETDDQCRVKACLAFLEKNSGESSVG